MTKKTILSFILIAVAFANTPVSTETFFTRFDANQDEKISKEEYLDFWQKYFDRRDRDNSNDLTIDEYFHREIKFDVFNAADSGGNGTVSVEEERNFRTKHFTKTDRNSDGFITLEEMLEK